MHNRRDVLAGGASALLLSGLAGCSQIPGMGGDESLALAVDSDYRDWVPHTDEQAVSLFIANPANFVDFDVIDGDGDSDGIFGTPTDEVGHMIELELGTLGGGYHEHALVAVGRYSITDARSGFESEEETPVEEDGTYGDFTTFAVGDGPSGYSIFGSKEDAILAASDIALFEQIVDAEQSDGERFVDGNDLFAIAAETLGNTDLMRYSVPVEHTSIRDPLVDGIGIELEGDKSAFTAVSVYGSTEAAADNEADALERWLNHESGTTEIESSIEGQMLKITGYQETEKLITPGE